MGFQAGLDVVAPADISPSDGATDVQRVFDLINTGNGTDQFLFTSLVLSDSSVVENVEYIYNSTTYADLAALNAALASVDVLAGDTLQVTVQFDVAAGTGGQNSDITVTAESNRDGTQTDFDVVNVAPSLSGSVSVAQTVASEDRLPGTGYTVDFEVTSTVNGTESVDLLASSTNGTNVTITAVNGVAGDSIRLSFAQDETKTITVTYTVADVAAGQTADVVLTANGLGSSTSGNDATTVTVVRPSLTITKGAYTDSGVTTPVSADVLPGETIYYLVTVTNTGTAAAESVSVEDVLPSQVTFVSVTAGSGSEAWTSLSESGSVVTGTLSSLSNTGGSNQASFIVEVTIN